LAIIVYFGSFSRSRCLGFILDFCQIGVLTSFQHNKRTKAIMTQYLHRKQAQHGEQNAEGLASLILFKRPGDQEKGLLSDHRR
jgi:hypothetical protein